jgi:hypothetical protein
MIFSQDVNVKDLYYYAERAMLNLRMTIRNSEMSEEMKERHLAYAMKSLDKIMDLCKRKERR